MRVIGLGDVIAGGARLMCRPGYNELDTLQSTGSILRVAVQYAIDLIDSRKAAKFRCREEVGEALGAEKEVETPPTLLAKPRLWLQYYNSLVRDAEF